MKKKQSFVIPARPRRSRAHRALFDDELPFQPKSEALKTLYKRNKKHRHKEDSED